MNRDGAPREFAELVFSEDGTPFAPRYQDVYRSRSGAGQAALVFVEGSGVQARLREHGRLSVLETGFGLGLNLAATLRAALEVNRPVALRYHAIELHPVRPGDLKRSQRELAAETGGGDDAVSEAIGEAYVELLARGRSKICLGAVSAHLRLVIGDGAVALARCEGPFDALYLDGFAPSRNAGLWSSAVFRELARLSRPGTTVATYTVARPVRLGLGAAGFEVAKVLGFGDKKFRLVGTYAPPPSGDVSEA